MTTNGHTRWTLTTDADPGPGQFLTAHAIVCADAGLYCEGAFHGVPWQLPVIAFDQWGRPLVAAIGFGGRCIAAETLDPSYVLLTRGTVVSGSSAPIEFEDEQGTRVGFVPVWNVGVSGEVVPLHVAGRIPTTREVLRDDEGNIVGVVEE